MRDQASPTLPDEADADLVARARGGCRPAFAELIGRHQGWLVNLLSHLLESTSDSEDVAQEALIIAWQRLEDLRDGEAFGAWLRRIAVNRGLAWRRRQARRSRRSQGTHLPLSGERAGAPGSDGVGRDAVRSLAVRQVLLQMKPAHAAVLVLKEMQGLSYREIAETLEVPVGTVRSRLHYARESFRGLWEE